MGNETSIDSSADPNADIKNIRKIRSKLDNNTVLNHQPSSFDDINAKLADLDQTLAVSNIDNYDDSSSAFVRAPARIARKMTNSSKLKNSSNPVSAASSPMKQEDDKVDNEIVSIKRDTSSAFSSPNFKSNSMKVGDSKSLSKMTLLTSFEDDDTSVNKIISKSKLNSGIHNLTSGMNIL